VWDVERRPRYDAIHSRLGSVNENALSVGGLCEHVLRCIGHYEECMYNHYYFVLGMTYVPGALVRHVLEVPPLPSTPLPSPPLPSPPLPPSPSPPLPPPPPPLTRRFGTRQQARGGRGVVACCTYC
jgi:hypothetical protein